MVKVMVYRFLKVFSDTIYGITLVDYAIPS